MHLDQLLGELGLPLRPGKPQRPIHPAPHIRATGSHSSRSRVTAITWRLARY